MAGFNGLGLPKVFEAFLIGSQAIGLLGIALDLFRCLLLVVVDVLFDGVAVGKHVKDVFFVFVLFEAHFVALALSLQDVLSFEVEHGLALLESCFELGFLFGALPALPLSFVDEVLLQSYLVELRVKRRPICIESISPIAVIAKYLSLEQCLVLSALCLLSHQIRSRLTRC